MLINDYFLDELYSVIYIFTELWRMASSGDSQAIGIDLGTSNSCVGVVRNGQVQIIANNFGSRTTPSVVCFTDREILVGEDAKSEALSHPENTIFEVKRLIGRKYKDPNVQRNMNLWPFHVIEDPHSGTPCFDVKYKKQSKIFSPEEISSLILDKMKKIAEDFIGEKVTKAVITVPAYFDDSQRQATIDAATISGLQVLELINEPTAAAIAYGFHRKIKNTQDILIFDLGGGTFDVAILRIGEGDFEVLAVNGDTFLGGGNFDERLVNFFLEEIERKKGTDLTESPRALAKLRQDSERAKIFLSARDIHNVQIDSLFNKEDFKYPLSRAKFEDKCSDLFEKAIDLVETTLQDINMNKAEIDQVILVGGSTRIPQIQKLLEEFFEDKTLNKTINPDEAVAHGAALHAALLAGEKSIDEYSFSDVAPLPLGITIRGRETVQIIPKNTKIPTTKTNIFTTSSNFQNSVMIEVCEGEEALTENNKVLGEFLLSNIESAAKGLPKIAVNFSMDKNGILNVTAEDETTGSKKRVEIKCNNQRGLKKSDIEKMRREKNQYEEEAQKEQDRKEAICALEDFCLRMKRGVAEKLRKGILSEEKSLEIQNACEEIQDWLEEAQTAGMDEIGAKEKEIKVFCAELLQSD